MRALSGHTQTRDDEPQNPRRERRAIRSSQRVAPESARFADRHAITRAVSAYSGSADVAPSALCDGRRASRGVSNQPLLPGPAEVPRRKQRHSRLAQPGPDIGRALVLGSANVRRARCSQSKNHQSIIKKRISNHRSSIINAWPTTPPITASRRRAASPPSRIPSSR